MWQQTFLYIWFAINAIGSVLLIGRKREVLTPGVAAWCVLIYAAIMLFVVGSI